MWLLLVPVIAVLLSAAAHAQTDDKELITKGQYIFSLAAGCACHSDPKGTPHAGGRPFPIPFGTAYSTNLTADKETGLGSWTDQQIAAAITKGVARDKGKILPLMPYGPYSGMAQDDLKALIAFLRTLKPVRKPTPESADVGSHACSIAAEGWQRAFDSFLPYRRRRRRRVLNAQA
jgi:hypothetical protein